ncbi:MAG: 3-hydroxyacyl-CoA dehydrogenase NAD-binding domain-containing protein [candidate division Zixibacteria bacterium]|nr:3-hydroxyacyl-CoA dehydrogenase NAD-binding domain-containing protein [candidate division Zixibacteria bacterium]
MTIKKVIVIGGGVMGRGISRLIAATGIEVLLLDLNEGIVKQSIKLIGEEMNAEIEKWGLTKSEKKAILSRIKPTVDLNQACGCDMLIEAIPEDLKSKQELFRKIDKLCSKDAIMVTNTSTLSVTEIASVTTYPEKVIGMHFLPQVAKVPLVEVVRGLKTSKETFELIKKFAEEQLNKTVVSVYEYPGYVTTRIIVPLLNEAMYVLMEGIASAEDIDIAMKLGYGFNIGPLALADMMGLDEVMSWMENLLRELSEHKYNPCPLLRKLVRAGHLGKKTGQGFFRYDEEGNKIGEAISFIKW